MLLYRGKLFSIKIFNGDLIFHKQSKLNSFIIYLNAFGNTIIHEYNFKIGNKIHENLWHNMMQCCFPLRVVAGF